MSGARTGAAVTDALEPSSEWDSYNLYMEPPLLPTPAFLSMSWLLCVCLTDSNISSQRQELTHFVSSIVPSALSASNK